MELIEQGSSQLLCATYLYRSMSHVATYAGGPASGKANTVHSEIFGCRLAEVFAFVGSIFTLRMEQPVSNTTSRHEKPIFFGDLSHEKASSCTSTIRF